MKCKNLFCCVLGGAKAVFAWSSQQGKYPRWLNIWATISLVLVPIGVIVAAMFSSPHGAFLCLVGFAGILATGCLAEGFDHLRVDDTSA